MSHRCLVTIDPVSSLPAGKSESEVDDEEIEALQKQLFDLRVKQATKQDLKTSDFKKLRKDIARRKTAQTSGDWSAVEAASDSAASGDSVAMFAVAGRKGVCSSAVFRHGAWANSEMRNEI